MMLDSTEAESEGIVKRREEITDRSGFVSQMAMSNKALKFHLEASPC